MISTVAAGRYLLEVGAPPGTSISASATQTDGDPRPLGRALKEGVDDGIREKSASDAITDVVDEASDVSEKVERAVALFTTLAEGKVLDPKRLSGEIDALLDLLARLDRRGRWQEAVQLGRALSSRCEPQSSWATGPQSPGHGTSSARFISLLRTPPAPSETSGRPRSSG
jgi:hypothetical protein